MSVKTRLQELNARLAEYLCSRFVGATADETTTALIDKLASIPQYIAKTLDIRPWRMYTTYPAYTAEDGTVTDPSISGTWNEDSVTLTSLVDAHAWPHAECVFNEAVTVGGARLLVDVEHSGEFNLGLHYKGADGIYKTAMLSDMVDLDSVDFPSDRTSVVVNFGKYVIAQGNTNPPVVANKYDLLAVATGTSVNYVHAGETKRFGDNTDATAYLMTDTIDLNVMPYLYYSISQEETSGCTFGLYCSRPWYMFRVGTQTAAPTMDTVSTNYTGSNVFMYGAQTGCIDLREYVEESAWSTFKVHELKLYGAAAGTTNATFNYFFFGSEPTATYSGAWGDPATPEQPLHLNAAVAGTVEISKVNYFVVGEQGDTVTLKQLTFATETQL